MTRKEFKLFNDLHKSRLVDLKTFRKRQYQGIWNGIIDKYPESAHFVYELLQNADDAEATKVKIELLKDALVFRHNGKIRFTVTEEIEDSSVILGHINSITSIGDSTKKETEGNKIGKFGVGFKSVFQYTNVPEIYDDTFCFKIEDYIVPTLLDRDFNGREKGETVFYFPFINPSKSYKEILSRLKNLNNPILFLTNLQEVCWVDKTSVAPTLHFYRKDTVYTLAQNNLLFEVLTLSSEDNERTLFHFTRNVNIEHVGTHAIKVGYYYDKHKQALVTNQEQRIFCFFPTKETFGTCYISHAPFKLVDSRQNIKEDEDVNKFLIDEITKLAADALPIIRDYGKTVIKKNIINSNIWQILPINLANNWYYEGITKSPQIVETFLNRIKNQNLFLTNSNDYTCANSAIIPTPVTIIDYFSDSQISSLIGHDVLLLNKGVVSFLSKDSRALDFARRYLHIQTISSSNIANAITADFMASQEMKWVLRFYSFLMNEASALWKPKGKSLENLPFRHTPIIPTTKNEWITPYVKDTLNVYIPFTDCPTSINFVNQEYLKEDIARKFFVELGIKEPNKRDYIESSILALYDGDDCERNFRKIIEFDSDIDDEEEFDESYEFDYDTEEYYTQDLSILDSHFMTICDYYQSLRSEQEKSDFVELVRKHYKVYTQGYGFKSLNDTYSDEPLLVEYFDGSSNNMLQSGLYPNSKSKYQQEFYVFLETLGVNRFIDTYKCNIYSFHNLNDQQRKEIGYVQNYSDSNGYDYYLVGFPDVCQRNHLSASVSALIWESLDRLSNLNELKYGMFKWKYYTWYSRKMTSRLYIALTSHKWMYGKDGNLYTPSEMTLENFNEDIYKKSDKLIAFFGIVKSEKTIKELGGTQEQQDIYNLGKIAKALNLTEEKLKHLIALEASLEQEQEDAQHTNTSTSKSERATKHKSKCNGNTSEQKPDASSITDRASEKKASLQATLKEEWEERKNNNVNIPHNRQAKAKCDTIIPASTIMPESNKHIDYGKTLTKPLKKLNARSDNKSVNDAKKQLEKALKESELLDLLETTPKYTFLWFKYLGEIMFGEKSKASKREVEITFSHGELACDDRVLIVSNANMVVPKWIEFPDSLEIILVGEKNNFRLNASLISIEDTSAQLQLNSYSDDIICWCKSCKSIILKAVSTQSIFNSLMTRFLQLDCKDNFDMNVNLPSNIEFIYGPPGTGKTTTLVSRVEQILSSAKDGIKILIMTPTNKAADVIACKMINQPHCYDALSRFGATENQELIEEGVLRDRESFMLEDLPKNVVVTTAARYAYDGIVNDNYVSLCDIDWDYIIIDEASMIDLFTITYILHKSKPSLFIVSGDPKQIQPTSNNDFQPENIYQMVGLNGFRNAITSFKRFKVIPLMTQYRSNATIGNLVSKFAYDGLISSDQSHKTKKLILDGMVIKQINIIAFPVIDFDNLFGQTAVSGSAIHIYSAIFTYNLSRFIAQQTAKFSASTQFTIGIVSPYRKQADIIQQLIDKRNINSTNCTVKCGTVHSFQGDECDIMILLLNSPTSLSSNCHALNENIINVGISRAKDYLFVITPDTNDPNFYTRNNLGIISQKDRADFHCLNLENIIFGEDHYIQNNTDIRCHLPVNVYSNSWAEYDVRLSDDAIDININA